MPQRPVRPARPQLYHARRNHLKIQPNRKRLGTRDDGPPDLGHRRAGHPDRPPRRPAQLRPWRLPPGSWTHHRLVPRLPAPNDAVPSNLLQEPSMSSRNADSCALPSRISFSATTSSPSGATAWKSHTTRRRRTGSTATPTPRHLGLRPSPWPAVRAGFEARQLGVTTPPGGHSSSPSVMCSVSRSRTSPERAGARCNQ